MIKLRSILRFVCRFYPLCNGCGTIANTSLFKALSRDQGEPVVTKVRGGAKIKVILDDYVGRSIYFFGDLDPKVTWICQRLLGPGDTLLDVGANWGLVTIIGAVAVGPRGLVHAFEPQPDLAEAIRASCDLNGFGQVRVHQLALSSTSGETEIYIPPGNRGAASVQYVPADSRGVKVKVQTSGDYFARLDLPSVRLMKIDVEGHEEDVIRGAADFFKERGPDAVLFESNDIHLPFWDRPSVQLLKSFGYEMVTIRRSNWRIRLRRVAKTDERVVGAHDYLAVRHSRRESVMKAIGMGT